MDSPITRAEHIEFAKRMEDEHTRQNSRIKEVEGKVGSFLEIASSVQQLAKNMEQMLEELQKQGARLDALEKKPADNWNTILRGILNGIGTGIAGAILGAIAVYLIK